MRSVIDCAASEMTKSASAAAVRRVADQLNCPAPRTMRTICARMTIMNIVAGMLMQLRAWCDRHGVFLIADEVMTGFGRTGKMFACEHEGVVPDFVACAKGLSGGYVPLAATLTTEAVYEAFLGGYEEMKSFFYGHSFTGNQLGCAAALASLAIFREERVLEQLAGKIETLSGCLEALKGHPNVGGIRQCGFIAGIDVVQASGEPYDAASQIGARICVAARKYGLLTRPVTRNT